MANYANQAYSTGTDVPQVEREALCGETASHAKRLSELNVAVDNLITRIVGPRPSQVGPNEAGKSLEPHLKEWSRRIAHELLSLEQGIHHLQEIIG